MTSYPWLRALSAGHKWLGWGLLTLGIGAIPLAVIVRLPGLPPTVDPWAIFSIRLVGGLLLFLLLAGAGAFELALGESFRALADLSDNSAHLVALAREAASRQARPEALLPLFDDTPRL